MKNSLLLAFLLGLAFALGGCSQEEAKEAATTAEEKVEQAAEAVAEEVKETQTEVGESVEKAGEAMQESTEEKPAGSQ